MSLPRLSEQQLEYLWSSAPHEPQWKWQVRDRLKLVLGDSELPLARWLSGTSIMREVRLEDVREVEQHLGKDYVLRNMLRSITWRLRAQISTFPLARIAIEVHRAANPINPDIYTAEDLQRSSLILTSLQQGLRTNIEVLNQEQRIGLLLMSAAYGGGLLDTAQLKAMLGVTPKQIEWIAGIPEIRLSLSIRGNTQAEFRQWFPDPATLALLVRCSGDVQELRIRMQRSEALLRCAQALLKKTGLPEWVLPSSMGDLFQLLRIQIQTRLPQLLVSFAAREGIVSQSLRPSCWGELFGYLGLQDPSETYGDRSDRDEGKIDTEDVHEWLQNLCRQVRAGEPIVRSGDASEFELIVTQWIDYMLGGASVYGNAAERKTIARYARVLGAALAPQLDGMSVFDVEIDTLETAYESVLEAQSSDGKRRVLAKAIHEFHTFLQRRYSYPPVSPHSLLGIGKGVIRVDARILSEDQFQSIHQALGICGLELRTPRLVAAARLLLVLGFRLGLRRNEALKLRLQDLYTPTLSVGECSRIQARHPGRRRLSSNEIAELALPVDLLIRPHSQRGLKTQNATRRLPLHVFLEPDELELLLDWHRQRQDEEAINPASQYLFCIPQLKTQWISEDYLLPAVHDCMRAVTGNEFVHYHHLRHSCATWLSLKLMGALSGFSPELIFRDVPLTTRWLRDDRRLQDTMLSTNAGPTRRIIHIVSAVLGHGSPKTTLLHYIHSLPQIMAMAWQWSPRNWVFSARSVAMIAGVSQPTIKAGGNDDISSECRLMLEILGRISALKELRNARHKPARERFKPVVRYWAISRIRAIESMLAYASYAEQTGREVNLNWVDFSTDERDLMLERARYICNMQQRARSNISKSKHRLQSTPHADASSCLSLLPSPPKHGGRDAVTLYAQRLYEQLEGPNSQRAQRVIDYFVERCWATDTTLRFYRDRDEEHALDYMWLLTIIGIPARSIELIIYDTAKPKSSKSYWRKRLGSVRRPISQHIPENPDVENLHLGIRATMNLNEEQQNYHSGSALRYLFLMASIDWHFRG